MEKLALAAEGFDDASTIGGLSEIATGAAGHENFYGRLAVFFEQERVQTALGSADSGEEAGGSGANYCYIATIAHWWNLLDWIVVRDLRECS